MDNRSLLCDLNKLNEELSRQIYSANRYSEFETCPIDADQDEVDRKYLAHERRTQSARIEYQIYEHLNELFAEFLTKERISSPLSITPKQKEQFKSVIFNSISSLIARISRVLKILHDVEDVHIDTDEITKRIRDNISEITEKLYAGQKLRISDDDLDYRLRKTMVLVDHREIASKQLFMNNKSRLTEYLDKEHKEKFTKAQSFSYGMYFEHIKTDVGFCGELMHIALVRLFSRRLVTREMTIQEILISYEEGDNHCFLGINLDKDCKLNDISTWGRNAILFDPWNKLVCMAEDFAKLPLYYFSYPDGAKWEVTATYRYNDYFFLSDLETIEMKFIISGNQDLDARLPLMKEEYELKTLENPDRVNTKKYLYSLLARLKPDNFNYSVELYLTTGGVKPICVLNGFQNPVVAIHKDIFGTTQFSREEIEFGIARALFFIKHYPKLNDNDVSDMDNNHIDRLVLQRDKNGQTAINYLKKCIRFAAEHRNSDFEDERTDNLSLGLCKLFQYGHADRQCEAQRIKHINTMLAQDETLRSTVNNTPIPKPITQETKQIEKYDLFARGFYQCRSKIDKIRYLSSRLNDLKVELIPYECVDSPGARLKEFCQLIKRIGINLTDKEQIAAIDAMVNRAFSLRIPGFEWIYRTVQGAIAVRNKIGKVILRPFGYFKDLQNAMDEFVGALSMEQALAAGEKIDRLYQRLKQHFISYYVQNSAGIYIRKYKNEFGKYPTGDDRFFGSTVGHYILWRSFTEGSDKEKLPWESHVEWALNDKSLLIARTLWLTGVVRDKRLWHVFNYRDMLDMLATVNETEGMKPLVMLKGSLTKYGDDQDLMITSKEYIIYSSRNHKLNTDMFVSGPGFTEQEFQKYFDLNLPALISPSVNFNSDNEAVHQLLSRMYYLAVNGDSAGKKLVKSFFLGRDDKRDLASLQKDRDLPSHLIYTSTYIQFCIVQSYQGQPFELFSVDEIVQLLTSGEIHFIHPDIPPGDYLRIFRTPFDSLNVDSMKYLASFMFKRDLHHELGHVFVEHVKLFPHQILSSEARIIIGLMQETISHPVHSSERKKVLGALKWNLPDKLNPSETYDIRGIVAVYRAYDVNLAFPTREQQLKLGAIILQLIENITDTELKLAALEELIFSRINYLETPISDINLRNKAVTMWVETIANKFGKDTDDDDYFEKIKVVIEKIDASAANRDKIYIYSHLANAIESQQRVSDLIGIAVEPEKYFIFREKKTDISSALGILSNLSIFLSKDKNDQLQLLDFLSAPLTKQSASQFASYLIKHKKAKDIASILGYQHGFADDNAFDANAVENLCHLIYQMFWDRKLEERAVIINYLLLPPSTVTDARLSNQAYNDAFNYVVKKIFPEADNVKSDDHIALSFLKSYLDTSNEFERGYLLTAMLVASNEAGQPGVKQSIGKKLAIICEHMGPAYVKLAQAIHSHPSTSEQVRRDLEHVKGKANPPHRWQIWRLLTEVLPESAKNEIQRVGILLGSASYNLAVKIKLKNGSYAVLSLLRENAAVDAKKGFSHLASSTKACKHSKIVSMSDSILSMINEAETLSICEMDDEMSRLQFAIADQINRKSLNVDGKYTVNLFPTRLLRSGKGYRFLELIEGLEFNDLPKFTQHEKDICKIVAKAILTMELCHILSGLNFDCDRHGNQLRINVDEINMIIDAGLYDFGEMSLNPPTLEEIQQFANVIKELPGYWYYNKQSLGFVFDSLLSKHIKIALDAGHSASYLMRIRKGLLALQDFQKHLTTEEIINIFDLVLQEGKIHPLLLEPLSYCLKLFKSTENMNFAFSFVKNIFAAFFGTSQQQIKQDNEIASAERINRK